jgi:hypothetical protein
MEQCTVYNRTSSRVQGCGPADHASVTYSNVYDWPDSPNGGPPHVLAPQSFEGIARSPHPGCCKDDPSAYRTMLQLSWLQRGTYVAHIVSIRNVASCWPIVERCRSGVYRFLYERLAEYTR